MIRGVELDMLDEVADDVFSESHDFDREPPAGSVLDSGQLQDGDTIYLKASFF